MKNIYSLTINRKLLLLVAALCLIPVVSPEAKVVQPVSETTAHEYPALIQVEDGLLTVSLKDVPLQKILQKLADETGMGFEVHGGANLKITAGFRGLSIERGIKRLLKSTDHSVVYTDNPEQEDHAQQVTRIAKIIILDGSGSGSGQPLVALPQNTPNSKPGGEDFIRGTLLDQFPGLLGDKSSYSIRSPLEPYTPDKSIEEYGELLKNKDPEIRMEIVSEIADEYGEKALPYLEDVLLHDSDSEIRISATQEISFFEGNDRINSLAGGLNDRNEEVREAVVEALGEIDSIDVRPLLEKAARDRNEDVREAALDLLEDLEDLEEEEREEISENSASQTGKTGDADVPFEQQQLEALLPGFPQQPFDLK